jgi:hypothetical protein
MGKLRNFFKKIAPIILAVASFVVPGLPALVGNFVMTAIGSTAVISTAAASAVGAATLNATVGLIGGASPEDIAKNIGSTLLTAGIGSAVTDAIGPVSGAAARSATGAALAGGDIGNIARSAVAGAAGVGLTELTGSQAIGNTARSLLSGQSPEQVAAAAIGGLGRDIQTGAFQTEPPEYAADMEGRPTGAPDTEPGAEIASQDIQPFTETPTYTDRLAQALQTVPQLYSMIQRPTTPRISYGTPSTSPNTSFSNSFSETTREVPSENFGVATTDSAPAFSAPTGGETTVGGPSNALASGLGTSAIGGRSVSTLASAPSGAYRDPAGNVEDVETGGKRRMAWNEASLRLKDALGV